MAQFIRVKIAYQIGKDKEEIIPTLLNLDLVERFEKSLDGTRIYAILPSVVKLNDKKEYSMQDQYIIVSPSFTELQKALEDRGMLDRLPPKT
jgi:hypothetical protein